MGKRNLPLYFYIMWNDLELSDKARMISLAVKSGITDLNTIHEVYNKFEEGGPLSAEEKQRLVDRINMSNADFVKRLKDSNRKSIPYKNGIATHRMAWATDDSGNAVVYPEVQSIGDSLGIFNGWEAFSRALERRDTVQMSPKEANWFTKNYKQYYPKGNTFEEGGDKATLNSRHYNAAHEEAMYKYLRNNGLDDIHTASILGNAAVESYLNADMKQKNGPAYGLIQAEASRQRAMRNYDEVPYVFGSGLTQEEQQQLDYIVNKGINNYTSGEWGRKNFSGARQARQAFINANTLNKASDIFTYNYLRPGKPHIERRRKMSNYYLEKHGTPYAIPLTPLYDKKD